MHFIYIRLLENFEHKRLSIFLKIYFSKRKFLQSENKTTASQYEDRRQKSNIIVPPILDVVRGISRGLQNDTLVCCVNAEPVIYALISSGIHVLRI